eukprot:CAMPEP_0172387238 /NCGR_PEP_ID=MMETSP1061-20121228/4576_1 /TAXON_ID=37318 /ORGANISM="Pseudo-nitzschia pungens, Strain cf. pungens" /LENGTH=249 /DNA_ID=CAMNT_0013116817 /DNA_START=197 /DNA_END=943 /DNA_ORIENTATION=-
MVSLPVLVRYLFTTLLGLAACTPTVSLGLVHQRRPLSRVGWAPKSKSNSMQGCTWRHERSASGTSSLRSNNNNNSNNNDENTDDSRRPDESNTETEKALLSDPGLWAADFLALMLAAQLIGLSKIVNNPEFVRNGGWFQPIPAVPSTLGDLVERISSFGVSWGIACVVVAATVGKNQSTADANQDAESPGVRVLIGRNLPTLAVFAVLQVLGTLALVGLENGNGNGSGISGDPSGSLLLDVLRNCYYVG